MNLIKQKYSGQATFEKNGYLWNIIKFRKNNFKNEKE